MKKMYRLYDNFDRKWVTDHAYLSPFDIVIEEGGWMKKLFGFVKLCLGSDVRYTIHRSTGMRDKNDRLIFEGDICNVKDGEFTGIVSYVEEHCAYYLLDHQNAKFYPLGEAYHDVVEVIGNVIDTPELIKVDHQRMVTYTNSEDDAEC